MLSHFIRARHLVGLIRDQAFTLVRADKQPKDPEDSVLPVGCFNQPFRGPIERTLGLSDDFLKAQARAFVPLRSRTFIMPWTYEPVGDVRQSYSEDGVRCELRASEIQLMRMLDYYLSSEAIIQPSARMTPEIPGGQTKAELKQPHYSEGNEAIPVIAFPGATACKKTKHETDAEVRVEAIIQPRNIAINNELKSIKWSLNSFAGLTIFIGPRTPQPDAQQVLFAAAAARISLSESCAPG